MIDFEAHFKKAEEGKIIWKKLSAEHKADRYILMPEVNSQYNFYALLYLDEYMEKIEAESVCIITSESSVSKVIDLFTSNESVDVVITSHEDIMRVIKYYSLYEFTSKLTIISLKIPYDTGGENLIGVKGVTRKDLFCFDIYAFNETITKESPVYEGNDEDILSFMRLGDSEYGN